jgi:hypothetical protein
MAVTLLVCWYSPVADLAARRCTASTLVMLSFFAKYLGLNIHKSLSWDSHIDKIIKKANSILAFLGRNVSRCPTQMSRLHMKYIDYNSKQVSTTTKNKEVQEHGQLTFL